MQSQDEPTWIMVIEVWEGTEAHPASVKNIPPGAMTEATAMLAGPPKGGCYRAVGGLPR